MNMVFRFVLAVLVLFCVELTGSKQVCGESIAANATSGSVPGIALASNRPAAATSEPNVSPGLELARAHLRELIPVLDHLRTHDAQQYDKAIRDLEKSAKRLESISRRDAKLYEISLREWKTRGHIDLLKAKLKVKHSIQDQQAMLERLQSLRDTELERVRRELVLMDERDANYQDRIRQLNLSLERGAALRQSLNEQRVRLESEPIDQNSYTYLKAIGAAKNALPRPDSSSKPKLKKATNE